MTNIARMSTEALTQESTQWEDGDTENYTQKDMARWSAVEQELEAREMWHHEDARVRESVGNYS